MTKEEILALRNEPWRDELRKKMSPKDRGALERVKMPELLVAGILLRLPSHR